MKFPERWRIRKGDYASAPGDGNGAAFIPNPFDRRGPPLKVIASDGLDDSEPAGVGWEHVSVSLPTRCPTWAEMCFIKDLFWDPEDPVMQLHPPRSQWVNNHPFCLHMWHPTAAAIPLPDPWLVGIV